MLISYNWLQEYFDEKLPTPEKLEELLTLKSFEIEEVKKVDTDLGEDYVIDVDVLPNRSHDCLCHNGIAKEVSMITGLKLKNQNQVSSESTFETKINIKNHTEICRRYIGCEVRNIKITDSPKELRAKLQALGQKSINNLVDITNIVMFEIGQPMHAFDLDKLFGGEINIREAEESEKITTLDKKDVDLNKEIIVIADQKNPLAIAGIKGGNNAEVDANTKNIILESANFNPSYVRKTSRNIAISTDSSKRFENEVTPELAQLAMNRAIELIMQYASNEKTEFSNQIDLYPKKWRKYQTGFSVAETNSLLGVEFSEKEICSALDKLCFQYQIVSPREKIVEEAQNLIGRNYKYGASVFFDAPKEFDCSSFVSYVYSLVGYSIPRMAVDQFVFSERIEEVDLLPGDLVFANTGILENKIDYKSVEFLKGTEVPKGVDHVGIYIGEGKVIHATKYQNLGVVEESLKQSERFKNTTGYGRIIKISDEKRFAVEAPIERLDIKNGPDLIEEVGRVLGYDKILDEPVDAKIQKNGFTPKVNVSYQLANYLKNILTRNGFSEIISYIFVKEGSVEPLKPIAEDKAFVRESLLVGMNDALAKNVNNADLLGHETIKLFEIGKVFKKVRKDKLDDAGAPENVEDAINTNETQFLDSEYLIEENLMLSIGVKNKTGVKKPKPGELLKQIVTLIEKELETNLVDKFNVKINDDSEVIEINLSLLLADESFTENIRKRVENEARENLAAKFYPSFYEIPSDTKYKSISLYPFMLRDIAVWVPSDVDESKVLELIKENSGELLVNYSLFDVYKKEEKTSYAFHLVFQSHEKTLTDEEANEIMERITQKMDANGWEVR